MGFETSACLKEETKLSKTIYGGNLELLTSKQLEENTTSEIIIGTPVSDVLRVNTAKVINKIFEQAHNQREQSISQLDVVAELVAEIIEEIITNDNIILNLMDLKKHNEYTFYHSVNVAMLSITMGIELELKKEDLLRLGLSALLHDIGKVFVDKEIIAKKDFLTRPEFEEIKKHSSRGYKYIKKTFELDDEICKGVLQHHERYNGTGYPEGIEGEDISLFGRIISIADVYDALTSDRPYRKGKLASEAWEYIVDNSGIMFDPKLVRLFERKIAKYPVGSE